MEKEQKLVKDTLTYMVANFGAKILILVIYPVYTYYVIPEILGVYDLIISTLTLFYPIIVFSINDAVFRWLLDYNDQKQSEIVSIGLKITLRNILIVDCAYIAVNLFLDIKYGWLVLAIVNFGSLYPVLQQIARGLRKNKVFAISGLLYAVALVLFNIFFVFLCSWGVDGLLFSQALAYLVSIIFLILSIDKLHTRWWKVSVSKDIEVSMTKYSLMLIPNSCCWWIMNTSDRYLIRFFIGNAANGIYAISHKFPSVMNMITSVFTLAWQEQAITEYSSEERDIYYSKIYRIYYLLLFSVCLVLLPITKWFVILGVQSDYVSAWNYSAALYLGSVFLALSSFLGTGYLSAKKTKGSMIKSIVGAVINIVVELILLPIIGLEADAISTLFGNISIWASRWIQVKKYFSINVRWGEFLFLTIINIFVGMIIRKTNFFVDIVILLLSFIGAILLNRGLLSNILVVLKIKKTYKGHFT